MEQRFHRKSGRLSAPEVGAVFGADFENVAGLYEEGDLDGDARFESGWLGRIVGGVAFDALGRIGDLELHGRGKVDADSGTCDEEDFDLLAFFDEVLSVAHELIGKSGGLVCLHVHEVEHAGFPIGKLELLTVGFHDIHLFAGSEADRFGLSGGEGADGGGDEGVALAGGAVIETEHDSALTSILDALSTFEIGCDGCHVDYGLGKSGGGVKAGET